MSVVGAFVGRGGASTRFYTGFVAAVASRARRASRLCVIAALGLPTAGCAAIQVPLGDIFGQRRAADQDITTGSLRAPVDRVTTSALPPPTAPAAAVPTPTPPPATPLAAARATQLPSLLPAVPLGDEDREAVAGTLASALLDQERAAATPWLNQRTGSGGMITAVGQPSRQGEATCRIVVVSVQSGADTRFVQGNACRAQGQEWSLVDVRPWRPPT